MTFDIPAGFPTHRHVTAKESLENWGPLHVFDANGKQIRDTVSVCVSSGEVITFSRDADGEYFYDSSGFLLRITTQHPAPLSVRPVTYDSPR
jgi:hypothetical protein